MTPTSRCRAQDKDRCPTHGVSARDPKLGRRLAYVLRHNPESVGVRLDEHGWADTHKLQHALGISRKVLTEAVAQDDKQRFTLVDNRIRAAQGHSINVELQHQQLIPPAKLYHGTIERSLDSIRKQGLLKGSRLAVHLSELPTTATQVGERRGVPVVLEIDTAGMNRDGYTFNRSDNGVWLTDAVPSVYISFPG